jgi:hypothetical protein
MLQSLLCQTISDWSANIIIDNPDDSSIVDLVKSFSDPRIRYYKLDQRYNDFGHTPRNIGKQISNSKYIIMTGDDNYYVPTTVYELSLLSEQNAGMIYWDMIHSHYDYKYFQCSPFLNRIDMGSFATRSDLAHQINLGSEYAADGLFVEKFKTLFPYEQILYIPKVLFVHN